MTNMFRYRTAFLVVIPVALAVMIVACGGGDYRLQEKYYLVAFNKKIPYWQNANAGLRRAAIELGVGAEMIGPDTYDPQGQKSELDRIIAEEKPPAGILVSASDADTLTPSINAAMAKGINVITIDSDAPDSKRLTFIGTNNYRIGTQSAEVTAQQLGRAGTVIVYTTKGQPNLEERLRGYHDVFNQFPAIRIIEVFDMKGDAVNAFERTKTEVEGRNRNRMDAFVCLEAISCPEVADVLTRNNVHDKVVIAMDTSERTLEWIKKGVIYATIAQRPYTMAYLGLRMLADLHKYPPKNMETESSLATVPHFVDTGATLVTKDNVDAFIKDQADANQENQGAVQ